MAQKRGSVHISPTVHLNRGSYVETQTWLWFLTMKIYLNMVWPVRLTFFSDTTSIQKSMGASVIPRNIQVSYSTTYLSYPFLVTYPLSYIESSHGLYLQIYTKLKIVTVHSAQHYANAWFPANIHPVYCTVCRTAAQIRSHMTVSFSKNSCHYLWIH